VTDGAALDDLRWHYGEAYLIELIGGRWIAQRRDSHGTVSAGSPDRLLDLIRADYAADPVPRDPRPCSGDLGGLMDQPARDAMGHVKSNVTRAVYRHQIADTVTRAPVAMDRVLAGRSTA
jgi:hypothetical protein